MIKSVLKTSVILFILGLTSGCISQQQLDSVEAAAQSASRSAAAATSAAEAAKASADADATSTSKMSIGFQYGF